MSTTAMMTGVAVAASMSGGSHSELSPEVAAVILIVLAASVALGACVAIWYAVKGDPWDSPCLMGIMACAMSMALSGLVAVVALLVVTAMPVFA